MSDPLRVAVVGGGIGRQHLLAYAELPAQFQVVAVCDVERDRADALARDFGVAEVSTRLAELCARADVDVIDLCTPSHLHYEQTLQALAAGKHVICEKPVANSLRQVDEIRAAQARSACRVMPIFQYRFGHGVQKLRRLIEAGVAGRPYLTTVETAWRRRAAYYAGWRGKWATELGGALVTLAIHAHDILYYLLGPATSVYARTATLVNPIETEDCVAAALQMPDGSLCTLAVTAGSALEISRHRFCFSNLTAESNTLPYANASEPWTFTADTPEVEARIEETLAGFRPLPDGYVGQFYRFAEALRTGHPLPVTLDDARESLELITAIYYSSQTNLPVSLPLSLEHPMYGGWQPQ